MSAESVTALLYGSLAVLAGILFVGTIVSCENAETQTQRNAYAVIWGISAFTGAMLPLTVNFGYARHVLSGIAIALPWPTILSRIRRITKALGAATVTAFRTAVTWW